LTGWGVFLFFLLAPDGGLTFFLFLGRGLGLFFWSRSGKWGSGSSEQAGCLLVEGKGVRSLFRQRVLSCFGDIPFLLPARWQSDRAAVSSLLCLSRYAPPYGTTSQGQNVTYVGEKGGFARSDCSSSLPGPHPSRWECRRFE